MASTMYSTGYASRSPRRGIRALATPPDRFIKIVENDTPSP